MADYYKWYKQEVNKHYILGFKGPGPGISYRFCAMVIKPNNEGYVSLDFASAKGWADSGPWPAISYPAKETQDRLFEVMRRLKLKHNLIEEMFGYYGMKSG